MRKLATKQNVAPIDGDFPFGRIKDNPGNNTGTPFNESLYGDIQQFFEKMFSMSGLVANGLPDCAYTGFQLFDALRLACLPYRSYSAELFQSTTTAPVVTVMPGNQLGNIVWARTGTGVYTATLLGAFPVSLTLLFNATTVNGLIKMTHTSANVITINTFTLAGAAQDGVLDNIAIDIRVYQ